MNNALRSLIVTIVLAVVVLGGAFMWLRSTGKINTSGLVKDSGAGVSDYSAVFLTNGQVYFGKINSMDMTQVDLRDIYYLQVNQQNLQSGDKKTADATAAPDISLVKLGNELHGPNDRMRINRSQVLFTESLKSDSKVVTAIGNYKSK